MGNNPLNTFSYRTMYRGPSDIIKDPLWYLFGKDIGSWRARKKIIKEAERQNNNISHQNFNPPLFRQNQTHNLQNISTTANRYPNLIDYNYNNIDNNNNSNDNIDNQLTRLIQESQFQQQISNNNFYHNNRPTHVDNDGFQTYPTDNNSTNANINTKETHRASEVSNNSNKVVNKTYGSICLRYLHKDLFMPNLGILKKDVQKRYLVTNNNSKHISNQEDFNFTFSQYNEHEICQFLGKAYRYFQDMPNGLKRMLATDGAWRTYFITYESYPNTKRLLNMLNEMFNTLSQLKSSTKNQLVFEGLMEIVDKNELECVDGSIIRISQLLYKDSMFGVLYNAYKEELGNLILNHDMGKMLVHRTFEIHLANYLDHMLINIPINTIREKDHAASILDSDSLRSLTEALKTENLEYMLADKFYDLVKSIFTYIFQEISKKTKDISAILEKATSLYKEDLMVLLPQNKTLNNYIIFKDSMPTDAIDEYSFIRDICSHSKKYFKQPKLFNDIFNKILIKQFSELSTSHEEIDRIRKSNSIYFSSFIRENMYRWICLDKTEKDLIGMLFKESDEERQQLLINLFNTDNFFNLRMEQKFELFANIRRNTNNFIQELAKTFQY